MSEPKFVISDPNPRFSTVGYVLVAIFFACVIFTGLLWGVIKIKVGAEMNYKVAMATGVALLTCVAVPHLVGLIYTVFVARHTPAAVIISVFTGFWFFTGIGFISFPKELDCLFIWLEPAMMLVVAFFGYQFYEGRLRAILLGGLFPMILLLWLTKMGTFPILGWVAKFYIIILGIWALVLAVMETRDATPPTTAETSGATPPAE